MKFRRMKFPSYKSSKSTGSNYALGTEESIID